MHAVRHGGRLLWCKSPRFLSGRKVERAPGRQAVMRWQVENAGRYWTGTQFTPPPERLLPRGKVARIATSPAWPNPLGVKLMRPATRADT